MTKTLIAAFSLVLCSCASKGIDPGPIERAPTRGIASVSVRPSCSYVLFEKTSETSRAEITSDWLSMAEDPLFSERLSGRALLPQVEGVVEVSKGLRQDEVRYEFLGVRYKAFGLMETESQSRQAKGMAPAQIVVIPLGKFELALRCGG
jgi:hypothetical protein